MEHRFGESVRGRLNKELDVRKNEAANSLDEYVDLAARKLHEITGQLKERTVQDLAEDVRKFARRRPAIFAGASIAAGVVAARFIRSSAADRDTTRRPQRRQPRPGARKR